MFQCHAPLWMLVKEFHTHLKLWNNHIQVFRRSSETQCHRCSSPLLAFLSLTRTGLTTLLMAVNESLTRSNCGRKVCFGSWFKIQSLMAGKVWWWVVPGNRNLQLLPALVFQVRKQRENKGQERVISLKPTPAHLLPPDGHVLLNAPF